MNPAPKVGVAAVVVKDGKLLMLKRHGAHGQGSWSVPGGHLEYGETIEETAVREAKEETGLDITGVRVIGVTNDIFTEENKHYITIWTVSDTFTGKESILEPEKCTEMGWFQLNELPSPLFIPFINMLKTDLVEKLTI